MINPKFNLVKVFVDGPASEKSNIIYVTKELEKFIKKELAELAVPTETI